MYSQLGTIDATEHGIELTPRTKPVHQPPYRAGHKHRYFPTSEVNRMLAEGVIRPSQSKWASPVVSAPKGAGSLRFCVDYRRFNAYLIGEEFDLHTDHNCLRWLMDIVGPSGRLMRSRLRLG